MLKSVFTIDQDRLRVRGIAVDGPTWLLMLSVAGFVLSLILALGWFSGIWPSIAIQRTAIACAVVAAALLVVTMFLWPGWLMILDRVSRQVMVDRGKLTGQRVPLEKVRFEIREIRHWYTTSRNPAWAFVARLPGEQDMQLYLSMEREKVKQLWQEMGEWLAAGTR